MTPFIYCQDVGGEFGKKVTGKMFGRVVNVSFKHALWGVLKTRSEKDAGLGINI